MLRRALAQLADCSCSHQRALSSAAASAAASTSIPDQDFTSLHRLVKEQPTPSPQRPLKFMQLFLKASSPEEAQEALALLQRDRQLRSKFAIHKPYSKDVSKRLLEMLQAHGSPDTLVSTLEQAPKLGLQPPKRALSTVLRRLSAAGDLTSMELVFLLSLLGVARPSTDMLFVMMKAFAAGGQPAKVLEYAQEAQARGLKLTPAMEALRRAAEGQ